MMSRFGGVSCILTILSAATMLCGWADRIDKRRDCVHNNAPNTYPIFIDRNDAFTNALPALQYMRIEAARIASEKDFWSATKINEHGKKIRLRRNKC